MKIFFVKMLVELLFLLCRGLHALPKKYEERLQCCFYDCIGYTCPFAIWGFMLMDKYDL